MFVRDGSGRVELIEHWVYPTSDTDKGYSVTTVYAGVMAALEEDDLIGRPELAALCALTITVARSIDASAEAGDFTRVSSLSYRLMVLLKELHLTPDSRTPPPGEASDADASFGEFIASLTNSGGGA